MRFISGESRPLVSNRVIAITIPVYGKDRTLEYIMISASHRFGVIACTRHVGWSYSKDRTFFIWRTRELLSKIHSRYLLVTNIVGCQFCIPSSRGLFGCKRLYRTPFGLSIQDKIDSLTSGCFGVPAVNRRISRAKHFPHFWHISPSVFSSVPPVLSWLTFDFLLGPLFLIHIWLCLFSHGPAFLTPILTLPTR